MCGKKLDSKNNSKELRFKLELITLSPSKLKKTLYVASTVLLCCKGFDWLEWVSCETQHVLNMQLRYVLSVQMCNRINPFVNLL